MGRRYTYTFESLSLTAVADLLSLSGFNQVAPTGNNTSGQNTITSLSSTTGVVAGALVVGAGVSAGTTVVSVSGTTATLSANTTSGSTGGTYYFITQMPFNVLRWWWFDVDTGATLPTSQMIKTRVKRLYGPITTGAGGAAVNAAHTGKEASNDVAATVTGRSGDTTQATGGANANGPDYLDVSGAHIYSGYAFQPPKPIPILPGQLFVFENLVAPSGTVTFAGGAEIEEIS